MINLIDPRSRHWDVAIVGAGQAGLATGYHLSRTALDFVLLDAHAAPGDAWRHRPDSLHLFSTRRLSALPGLELPGDPEGYPHKDEVAGYLRAYATRFSLPIAPRLRVTTLRRRVHVFELATADGARLTASAVVVAAGSFQRVRRPDFAVRIASSVLQLDATLYRRPSQLPPGRVLVVGGGGSGRQIAAELAATHEVWLSADRGPIITPQRVLGRDLQHVFERLGLLRADKATLAGRMVRARDAFPGRNLRNAALRRQGVTIVPRCFGAEGTRLLFDGARGSEFSAVVWATGFEDDSDWIQVPGAKDALGRVVEERGRSRVPGLFYVGRSWQNSRASALLCGVGDDAARIVDEVEWSIARSAARRVQQLQRAA